MTGSSPQARLQWRPGPERTERSIPGTRRLTLPGDGGGARRGTRAVRFAATFSAVRGGLHIVLPAAAIVSLIVGGMAIGLGAVAAAGGALALFVSIVVPEIGLAVLVFLSPLQPPPSIPAPGLNLMLVGAMVLGCILRLPIERPSLRVNASLYFLTAFVVYVFLQQLPEMLGGWSGDKGHAVGYLFFQLMTGLGTIIAGGFILRDRSPYAVLAMSLAGAVVASLIAILTYDSGGGALGNLVAVADLGQRAAGSFVNPNYLGAFVAAGFVGCLGLWAATTSRTMRAMLIVAALLCVLTLVEAQSRGAILAAFAGTAAISWMRSRALTTVIVASGVIAAFLIYPAFVQWRLSNLHGGVSDAAYVAMYESDDTRLGGALAGPALFLAEPVFGVGLGEFSDKSVTIAGRDSGINAHNWYVNVFAEQGSIGGVLWLAAFVAAVRELRTRPSRSRMAGFGILTTLAVGFLFLEGPTSFQTIGLPVVFLIAAVTSDWGDVVGTPRSEAATAQKRMAV